MKFTKIFVPIFVASLGYAVAQEAEVSPGGKVTTGAADCDEICAAKVAEVVAASTKQIDGLKAELAAAESAKAALEAASQQSAAAAKSEIEKLKGELSSSEASALETKRLLEDVSTKAKKYADGMAENAATHSKTVAALQKDLSDAKADVAKFKGARLYVNIPLIKSDIRGLFKKIKGFVKEKI